MKKILVLLLSFAFCFSACKTTLSQEQTKETQQLATSLSAAGFLGTSFQNSSDFWEKYFAEEETYYIEELLLFYCLYHPNHPVYPEQLAANDFETWITKYFDLPADLLHHSEEYQEETDSYIISVDISPEQSLQICQKYFHIDSISLVKDKIKVDYRILWGDMAPSGHGEEFAYEGYLLLNQSLEPYWIDSCIITKDQSTEHL